MGGVPPGRFCCAIFRPAYQVPPSNIEVRGILCSFFFSLLRTMLAISSSKHMVRALHSTISECEGFKGTIAASNRLNTKGAQVEVLLPKLS